MFPDTIMTSAAIREAIKQRNVRPQDLIASGIPRATAYKVVSGNGPLHEETLRVMTEFFRSRQTPVAGPANSSAFAEAASADQSADGSAAGELTYVPDAESAGETAI